MDEEMRSSSPTPSECTGQKGADRRHASKRAAKGQHETIAKRICSLLDFIQGKSLKPPRKYDRKPNDEESKRLFTIYDTIYQAYKQAGGSAAKSEKLREKLNKTDRDFEASREAAADFLDENSQGNKSILPHDSTVMQAEKEPKATHGAFPEPTIQTEKRGKPPTASTSSNTTNAGVTNTSWPQLLPATGLNQIQSSAVGNTTSLMAKQSMYAEDITRFQSGTAKITEVDETIRQFQAHTRENAARAAEQDNALKALRQKMEAEKSAAKRFVDDQSTKMELAAALGLMAIPEVHDPLPVSNIPIWNLITKLPNEQALEVAQAEFAGEYSTIDKMWTPTAEIDDFFSKSSPGCLSLEDQFGMMGLITIVPIDYWLRNAY